MPRSEALIRITKGLMGRRAELRKRLGFELADLGHSSSSGGDAADAAFEHAGEEMASHLAEVEARELAQVERALVRIKQGKYGSCDGCNCKIPVARLNALPYTTLCIQCQRDMEKDASWIADHNIADWNKVSDHKEDRDVNINDLEYDVTK
jgi:DnaK suppressor protein